MTATHKAKIPIGFVIADKYRVTGELGRGGMASVYEAENMGIGKRVAIKVLAQELTSSTVVVERFLREARAVAAIRSPYICDVYDTGALDDGRPFLVLELLEGESLYERMVRVGPIDTDTLSTVMVHTCRGLTKAHSVGIVHRDLKPENIFLTKDEEGNLLAKILDFGLAKFYTPVEEGTEQARLTREGAVFGTPAYMSPEQVRGQGAVDARADLWALGCIAYECLTGKTVWATEQGVAMTFAQIAQNALPDPFALRPDLPAAFGAWFSRALHRSIDERFQTPRAFSEELVSALGLSIARGETSQEMGPRGSSGALPSVRMESPTAPGVIPDRNTVDPTTRVSAPPAPPTLAPPSKNRGLLAIAALAIVGAAGFYVWRNAHPGEDPLPATASAAVEPAPSASASAPVELAQLSHDDGLPFRPLIAEAQGRIADGDLDGAREKVRAAFDLGAHYMPQTFAQHLDAAKAGWKKDQPCELRGLGRPRSYDLMEEKVRPIPASFPSIAVTAAGAVMTWTEPVDGNQQAFAVALDPALRAKTRPFQVTPEARQVQKPELLAVGDRILMTYWDTFGPEAGVYARYLDADGRIASAPTRIAESPGGASFPTASVMDDGSFIFTWVEPTDRNSEDLYARTFSAALEPKGEKMRLTVLRPGNIVRTKIRFPVASFFEGTLRVTYRLERDPDRLVQTLSVPLSELGGAPLPTDGFTQSSPDRFKGALETINAARVRSDLPTMGCSKAECFLAWNDERADGIWSALLPAGEIKPLFRLEVVKNLGRHPALAVSPSGSVQMFWYERGKLQTGSLNRDGIGETTTIARMSTQDQAMAAARPGRAVGEWYVAWLDYEGGHLEVFAARTECR